MFDEIYDDDFTADNTAAADRCLHRHRRPSIRPFVEHHDLDGFDIDYEVPQFTSAQKFKEVAQEVRQAHGPDHLFTITPNNTRNLDGPTLEQHFDYVNVQSYDAKGDEAFSVDDVLGLPASMVLAGADIENPNSYRNDESRVAWAINQHKTKQLGGVFIWQLKPSAQQLPGGTFKDYANQVRDATHPSDASS